MATLTSITSVNKTSRRNPTEFTNSETEQKEAPTGRNQHLVKIRSVITAFVAALACVLGAASTSYASSAPATGVVRVESNGHIENHVVAAVLASKINSGNWRNLSTQQLASAGIHPGMNPGLGKIATAAVAPKLKFQSKPVSFAPESASGCNSSTYDSMCIYVTGSGLKVNDWDTSVSNYFGLDKCTYAGYWVAGVLYRTSNEVCGDGDFWAYWAPNQYFINGTQLCNTWVNWAGKPCETVHS